MATFSPGFRFSVFDAVILIIGAVAAAILFPVERRLGVSIAFVVAHFFLFCNILRISRPLELIWADAFVLLAAGASLLGVISWSMVFVASAFVTFVVALLGMRLPSYHGVGWRTLNSQLPEWWQRREADDKRM